MRSDAIVRRRGEFRFAGAVVGHILLNNLDTICLTRWWVAAVSAPLHLARNEYGQLHEVFHTEV